MKNSNTAFMFLFSACLLLGCKEGISGGSAEGNIPSIRVTGEGSVETVPDEAMISFGVTSEGKALQKSYRDNTDKINASIQSLKSLDIAEKDMKTSSYSVSPIYGKDERGRRIEGMPIGFRVSQQLSIRVRDITKVGKLIDKVIADGSNVFSGIQFSSSQQMVLEKEAKKSAAKDAKANASLLADSLGVKLGRLLSVSDNLIRPSYGNKMMMRSAMSEMAAAPSIQAGSMEIRANCNVEYEIIQ